MDDWPQQSPLPDVSYKNVEQIFEEIKHEAAQFGSCRSFGLASGSSSSSTSTSAVVNSKSEIVAVQSRVWKSDPIDGSPLTSRSKSSSAAGSPMSVDAGSPAPAASRPVTLNNGCSPARASPNKCPVQLVIVTQPTGRCRFRYKAEQGGHGALRGADADCPKVKIENFKGRGRIVASLFTNEEIPRTHVNELWGPATVCVDGRCTVDLDGFMSATFPNLGIMRQKEKEVGDVLYEKYLKEYQQQGQAVTEDVKAALRQRANREMPTMKDCLHCVRVGFQGFLVDESTGAEHTTPIVFSSAVYNSQHTGFSELRIAEVSKGCGTVLGGDKIWMRCAAKVRRDQIKIKFCEPASGWESEGNFSVNEVYEQILIIFTTPAYRDVSISDKVPVHIRLFRTSDGQYSPPVDFVYLPVDDGPAAKRPRLLVPTFGPTGFGYTSNSENLPSSGSGNNATILPESQSYTPGGLNSNAFRIHQNSQISAATDRTGLSELDSGIGLTAESFTSMPTEEGSWADLGARLEQLSIAELSRLSDTDILRKYLSSLWQTHVSALWNFGAEGDPEPLVMACRQLIALQDEHGNTALHTAAKNKQSFALKTMLKVLDTLPNKQEIINQTNKKKQTALHLAVRCGDDDCVHYMITAGADRLAIDADGQSVAHYLANTFNEGVYRDILFPPKETAAAHQQLDLGLLNNDGNSALHLAIKTKKLALVENLLEARAPVDVAERTTGKSSLHLAVEADDQDAVDLLVQSNAPVDSQAYEGTTPLQLAVRLKLLAIIAKLIAAGADPNSKTSFMKPDADDEDEGHGEESDDEEAPSQTNLCSAEELAKDDQQIIDLLKGKPYDVPVINIDNAESTSRSSEASGGARPKTSRVAGGQQMQSEQSFQQRLTGADGEFDQATASRPSAVRRRFSSDDDSVQELVPSSISDDLASLDYVTRVRLAKLLDEAGRWEKLARSLECQHMIECLKVCAEADGSSPTVLLLDQYEHTPGASINRLLIALNAEGHRAAVDMIVRKQSQQQGHAQRSALQQSDEPSDV